MSQERCRCGTCGRFIGHMADDDNSCARCRNYPVYVDGADWQPAICARCRKIMKDDFDPPVPWR